MRTPYSHHCTVDEQKDELGGRSAVSLILREKKYWNLQKHAEKQKRILRNVEVEICVFHIVIYFARSSIYFALIKILCRSTTSSTGVKIPSVTFVC